MPVETWVKIVKRVIKASNANKQMILSKIVSSVTDPYLTTLFDIVEADERDNKNMTTDAILDEFVTKISKSNINTALFQFQNAKQKQGETAFDHGLNLKRLATNCFVGVDQTTVDKLILHRFLESVTFPLREKLKISMPKTLDEAMNNSLVLEGNTPRTDPTTTMNSIRQDRLNKDRQDGRDQIMQRRDMNFPRFQGKLPTNRAYNPNRKYDRAEQQQKEDKVSAIDLNNVTCFRCKKLGHMARFCKENRLNSSGQVYQDSSGKKMLSQKQP